MSGDALLLDRCQARKQVEEAHVLPGQPQREAMIRAAFACSRAPPNPRLPPTPAPPITHAQQGGGLRDSFLVDGVAFKKTFSYAGFEMQPKSYDVRGFEGGCQVDGRLVPRHPGASQPLTPGAALSSPCGARSPPAEVPASALAAPLTPRATQNPKILLLNIELELKSEKENAEVRLDDPAKYQSIVDAGEPPPAGPPPPAPPRPSELGCPVCCAHSGLPPAVDALVRWQGGVA